MNEALAALWEQKPLLEAVMEALVKVGDEGRHFVGGEFQHCLQDAGFTKGVAQQALRALAAGKVVARRGPRSNLLDELYLVQVNGMAELVIAATAARPPAEDPAPAVAVEVNGQLPPGAWTMAEVVPVFAFPAHIPQNGPSIAQAIIHVIDQAQEQVGIQSPFIDRYGVETFREPLLRAAARGVRILVLTRIGDGDQQREAVRYLADELAEGGSAHRLEVRSFHKTNPEGKIAYSLHTKLVLADRTAVYVGSGELRYNSLHALCEGGALFRGPVVRPYAEVWDQLWTEHATAVMSVTEDESA